MRPFCIQASPSSKTNISTMRYLLTSNLPVFWTDPSGDPLTGVRIFPAEAAGVIPAAEKIELGYQPSDQGLVLVRFRGRPARALRNAFDLAAELME
jgi:hypothetical protein